MAKKLPASTSGFKSYAGSDQGIRGNNEDEVFADDDLGIYFVIDGMGGHAAGEQAARIAKERLLGRLNRATGNPQQRIREAIALANNAIFEAAAQHPDWSGMACVLTVAHISSQTATIGHVGDSRLYKVRGPSPELEKITRDHSPIGELEDSEQLSEAEAMAHPRRNEVYRDVGSTLHDPDDKDFIDIYEISLEPDSGLLLCSDGLTDALPLAAIRKILRENVKDPPAAVASLIRQAIDQGGKDNISAVLVRGPDLGSARLTLVGPKENAGPKETPAPAALPSKFIAEERSPRRHGIAWAIFWMALGAALLFGSQSAIRLGWLDMILHTQPTVVSKNPPGTTPQAPRTPQTILVNARQPGAQPTIAAALAVAAEGDTIELAPAIYDEPFRIEKSDIRIEGSGALLRPKPTAEGSDGITITKAAGVQIRNLRISGDADGDLLAGIHIVDSQVTLRNVHVTGAAGPGIEAAGASTLNMDATSIRDCSGPGMLLRGAAVLILKYSAIVGNGRDPGDRQPGIMVESPVAPVLAGNTFANNGGPAITQPDLPSQQVLAQNLFSLEGRKGRLEDIRVIRKRATR